MRETIVREMLKSPATKLGFATRMVPKEAMANVVPLSGRPRVGDVVLTRIKKIGRHKRVEVRGGYNMELFEDDYLVGSFGNRYATGQFEGYVPSEPVSECDLYSAGAVMGETASRHASMAAPTRLEVVGAVADEDGIPLNQRDFGLSADDAPSESLDRADPEVIVVVGSSMDSGKTTTAAAIIRSLVRSGFRVGAAKVTGTATGKDCRLFASSGADPVYDFISAGYPSTYMISHPELLEVYGSIVTSLTRSGVDYVVLEIADGIFQRETAMLLDSDLLRESVDHIFFAAGDALAVGYGVGSVRAMGLPLRATSGAVTASELGRREAEALTDLPCLGMSEILSDGLLRSLGREGVFPLRVEQVTVPEKAAFPVGA